MYLKNTILFFCVTLHFLQCQGLDPTPEQRRSIKHIVASNVGQDGNVAYNNLITVLNKVAGGLDKPTLQISRVDELKINFLYTMDDVEIYSLAFAASADPEKAMLIKDIVTANMGQAGINLNKLKAVFAEVAKQTGLSKKFPRIDVLKRAASNRIFTEDEVGSYSLAFVASENPKITTVLKKMLLIHGNSDGMDYEELKEVVEGLMLEMEITKPFPSYDEFKADYIRLYPNAKLTVDQVETIVIDNLFS